MADSRPITVTYVPPGEYTGKFVPSPHVVVGEPPQPSPDLFKKYLETLPGYGTPFAVLTITEDGSGYEWLAV